MELGWLEDVVARLRTSGVDFADARHVNDERESLNARNDSIESALTSSSSGVGVRVLYSGAWVFAARAGDDPAVLEQAAQAALEVARANAALRGRRGSAPI